jgi:IMP dehydrogenase
VPFIYEQLSRTFAEFLLIPNLTTKVCVPENVSLATPVVRFRGDFQHNTPGVRQSPVNINIPIASAIMQSVSGPELAIALARGGGIAFVFCSQPIESEASMVRAVKRYKAGFVVSDSNLRPDATLADVLVLTRRTGHSRRRLCNWQVRRHYHEPRLPRKHDCKGHAGQSYDDAFPFGHLR